MIIQLLPLHVNLRIAFLARNPSSFAIFVEKPGSISLFILLPIVSLGIPYESPGRTALSTLGVVGPADSVAAVAE